LKFIHQGTSKGWVAFKGDRAMRKRILYLLMLAMFLGGSVWLYVKKYDVCISGACRLNYHNVSKAPDNPSLEAKIN
jgi:hypothetical protein